MSWEHYLLVFRLKSPLHIGLRKVGNLMQTRPYVPGRVLWGALTARLVRDYSNKTNGDTYQKIGSSLKKNFRFGYLWPALCEKENPQNIEDLEVKFPWKDNLFDYYFLDCYAGTALDYTLVSTAEGSLHHVEFIRPYTRLLPDQKSKQVYLVGDIFVNKDVTKHDILKFWPEAIGNVQFGGERAYGWGRVELVACKENQSLLEKEGYDLSPNDLTITAPEKSRLLAHLKATNSSRFRGQVEVLTAYHMRESGELRLISSPPIAFPPGTMVTQNSEFILSEEPGLWELKEDNF